MSRLLALFSADSSFNINACKQQNEDLKRETRFSRSGKSTSKATVNTFDQQNTGYQEPAQVTGIMIKWHFIQIKEMPLTN